MRILQVNGENAYECRKHKNYFITKSGILYSIFIKGAHGKTDITNPRKVAYGQDRDGYYRVVLSENTKHTYVKIHTLVAEQFIGDVDTVNNMVVNHKDGNIHNNNVDNLEIITNSENSKHAWRTGLCKIENNPITVPVIVYDKEKHEEIRFPTIRAASDYIRCPPKYLCLLRDNSKVSYGYCYFEKITTGTKNTDYYVNCYFNGTIYKTFNSNEEVGIEFGKSKNTISYIITNPSERVVRYNNYIISFP